MFHLGKHLFRKIKGSGISPGVISCQYWWLFLSCDVKDFGEACSTCAQNNHFHQKPAGLLLPLPGPYSPWTHITVDFITFLPSSSHCMVLQDDTFVSLPLCLSSTFSTYMDYLSILSLTEEVNLIFWHVPCGSKFLNFSSVYHPQTNRQVEHFTQILENYLQNFVTSQQENLASLLPCTEFS